MLLYCCFTFFFFFFFFFFVFFLFFFLGFEELRKPLCTTESKLTEVNVFVLVIKKECIFSGSTRPPL